MSPVEPPGPGAAPQPPPAGVPAPPSPLPEAVAPVLARPRTRSRAERWTYRLGWTVASLLAVATVVLLGLLATLPPLDKATDYRPRQHLQVMTADGVEIAQFGTERRLFVPLGQVPPLLRDAVLAVEDADFYDHGGISWRGLSRAVLANLAAGSATQGASTITQQLARTLFLSMRRTPERKIKEALLALRLERELSKDQILELYLNQIFLGQRAYGVGAAAVAYFGKALPELTTAEAAMVAGLAQNPVNANPFAAPERARKRQLWVLSRMRTTGVVDEATYRAAVAEPLVLRTQALADVTAQHVAEMARRAVVERLGEKAYTDGVRVVTSIVAEDQRVAYAALRRAVIAHERKQDWRGPESQESLPEDAARADLAAAQLLKDLSDDEDLRVAVVLKASPRELQAKLASGETVTVRGETMRWLAAALGRNAGDDLAIRRGSVVRLYEQQTKGRAPEWIVTQWPETEAAFVALDPATGRVRALVGGFDFNRNKFNRATSALRQPGSSFKPFLYSAALEHGIMPETIVDDWPLSNPDGSKPSWNPQNSDNVFSGDMPLREGLVRSKNLVSVRVLQHLGLRHARSWIERFGFDMAQQPSDLTLALGTGSVTPLQLAAGYAVFANGGHRVAPVLVERIVDAQGRMLWAAPPPAPLDEGNRAIPARNAFVIDTLLRDVTARGTARLAQATLKRSDLYGKTGTTNDAVDAWFAGFAPGVVAVGWVGFDEPRSLGERETGGGLALPIWIEFMQHELRQVSVQPLMPPSGVVAVGGGYWRYSEYAGGGFRGRIGEARAPRPPPPEAASESSANGAPAVEPTPLGGPLPMEAMPPR